MAHRIDYIPITLDTDVAKAVVNDSAYIEWLSDIRGMSDDIARMLIDKKVTPVQAQAVLVQAWDTVVSQCVLALPPKK